MKNNNIFIIQILLNIILLKYSFTKKSFCEIGENKAEIYYLSDEQKEQIKEKEKKFGPINIFLDYSDITTVKNSINDDNKYQIVQNSLIECLQTIQKLINVTHLNYPIYVNDLILSNANISSSRVNQSLFYGINADLVVILIFTPSPNDDIKIVSKELLRDEITKRTILGSIEFDINFRWNYENVIHYFKFLILHGITHILGFSTDSFQYFPGGISNTTISKIEERSNVKRTYIITPTVVKYAKKYFGCNDNNFPPGVELEDQEEDEEKIGNHWEARILLGEYMTSEPYTPEQVISEFTLALLEDSGWYQVNYYTGGLMRFGKHKGCDFLNKDCLKSSKALFKNEFCHKNNADDQARGCSSGRQSRGYCMTNTYTNFPSPSYNRFSSAKGGIEHADLCFGIEVFAQEENNAYYIGNCKNGINEKYGSLIMYNNQLGKTNSIFTKEYGEKIGIDNSFCAFSSVSPIKKPDDMESTIFNLVTGVIHPMCYPMTCTNYSLTIQIYNQYIVCPRSGGKVEVNGDYKGYLLCPDYNLICTGTVMCNDMFDCVDKRSLLKNATYDYEINSNINFDEILEDTNIIEGYEMTNEGICPHNCGQCKESKKCIKCRQNYNLIGKKENDNTPVICSNTTNLQGYYLNKETNTYYLCMDYCVNCDNYTICNKCDNIHKTNENQTICLEKVEHCQNYSGPNFDCSKCKPNYAFIMSDRETCHKIDEVRFYTLDDGLSYYPCNTSISHCDECYNNKDNCRKCQKGYYFLKEDRKTCLNNLNLSKYFSDNDGISYYPCNTNIDKCDECENKNDSCSKCITGYYFIGNNRIECQNGITNFNKYYTEDGGISYYLCSGALENCDECNNNKSNCVKCISEYYFIGDSREKCFTGIDKTKYYTKDNGISYYPCDTHFPFCEKCTDENTCTNCKPSYGFLRTERNKCIFVANHQYYTYDDLSFYPCSDPLPNCKECLNEYECSICQDNFYFLKQDRERCYNINISKCYTLDNGTSYYFCNESIDFCDECYNGTTCKKCINKYYFLKKDRENCINDLILEKYYSPDGNISYYPCEEEMKNCYSCISKDICTKCIKDYYFVKNKKDECFNIDPKNYYTQDNISYFPCNESIEQCDECSNNYSCSKCYSNYSLLYESSSECVSNEKMDKNESYFKINETHYEKCSTLIGDCKKCEINSDLIVNCNECEPNYFFINDNLTACYHVNEILPADEYYKFDNLNYYSCPYKIGIENCRKCINQSYCTLCENSFAFLSDNFTHCYNKKIFSVGYYHNKKETIYYPCISHCDTCFNDSKCEQCSINYSLFGDKTVCDFCQVIINTTINIDIKNNKNITHLANEYINKYKDKYSIVEHFINKIDNYTVTIFRDWKCTESLIQNDYFQINTNEIHSEINKNRIKNNHYVYCYVTYKNKNYLEMYDIENNKALNIKLTCEGCINENLIITNNYTNELNESLGEVLLNKIKEYDIDLFDIKDKHFNDLCYNFEINNIDIPLQQRKELLYRNNIKDFICTDSNCEIESKILSNFTGVCKCKLQNNFTYLISDSEILDNNNNKNIDDSNKVKNSFELFKCHNQLLDSKLASNISLYIAIVFIIIQIISFVCLVPCCHFSSSKATKIPGNPPKSDAIVITDDLEESSVYSGQDEIKVNQDRDFDEIEGENEEEYEEGEDEEKKRQCKDISSLKAEINGTCFHISETTSTNENVKNTEGNDKKLRNESMYSDGSNPSLNDEKKGKKKNKLHFGEETFTPQEGGNFDTGSNDGLNKKKIKKSLLKKSSDSSLFEEEVNEIKTYITLRNDLTTLKEAVKNDKKSNCEYYCYLLKIKQPIIDIFISFGCFKFEKSFVPLSMKIAKFVFILSLNLFINALHLEQKYFKKKFEHFNGLYNIQLNNVKISSSEIFTYSLSNTVLFGFISFIKCYIIQFVINYFFFNINNKINKTIVENTNGDNTNDSNMNTKIIKLLKNEKRNYIIIFWVGFILMLAFLDYLMNFNTVYRGGVIDYLAAMIWTFLLLQIMPFITCLILALIRNYIYKKYKENNEKNEKLYKLLQILT